jgi:transposase
MSDGQDIRMVSTEELHRSIAWAYKWLRRFDKEGLEGLKNKPRSSGLTSRCTPKEAIKDKN